MSTINFRSYSFASLPSGFYLFFPATGQAEGRTDVRSDDADGTRTVVVSTGSAESKSIGVSGAAAGSTLFVDLDRADFDQLLKSLPPERNLRDKPVIFDFELDREESLSRLTLDNRRIGAYDPSKSGIPPARANVS
jgi:hypothetical protein